MSKKLVFLLGPTLLSLAAGAQSSQPAAREEKVKTKTTLARPWAVKWNPLSLAFGKIGLSGERALSGKKSVTFGIGIPVARNFSRSVTEYSLDLSPKTFSVMGGYRMYLGKSALKGVYFEPYLKYVNLKGTGRYDNKSVTNRDIYQATVKYSGVGVGAQLGVQFQIAKVVVLDLFLLGPEANSTRFEGDFHDVESSIPWTQIQEEDARREIEDVLKDIPIVGDKTEITVNRNERRVHARYNGFLPGFRAGLSVGIRF